MAPGAADDGPEVSEEELIEGAQLVDREEIQARMARGSPSARGGGRRGGMVESLPHLASACARRGEVGGAPGRGMMTEIRAQAGDVGKACREDWLSTLRRP